MLSVKYRNPTYLWFAKTYFFVMIRPKQHLCCSDKWDKSTQHCTIYVPEDHKSLVASLALQSVQHTTSSVLRPLIQTVTLAISLLLSPCTYFKPNHVFF